MKDNKGQPVYKLAILNDITIVPGDSGGGNWYNGKLIGNTWASYFNTIKLPFSSEISLAAPLPIANFPGGGFQVDLEEFVLESGKK